MIFYSQLTVFPGIIFGSSSYSTNFEFEYNSLARGITRFAKVLEASINNQSISSDHFIIPHSGR